MPSNMPSKKRHLAQLPVKNTQVAPGDLIGGLIYIMDKPIGVEEGMIGISIDNAPYRAFIKKQLLILNNPKPPPK